MKQDWHPEELALHWTLSESELELLGTKTGATRLSLPFLEGGKDSGKKHTDRSRVFRGIEARLARPSAQPPEARSS
jgi:hypothetical protein